jgi:hypothetical protein
MSGIQVAQKPRSASQTAANKSKTLEHTTCVQCPMHIKLVPTDVPQRSSETLHNHKLLKAMHQL